jgi:uncharacterized membrane protein (UPF0127 family)
MVFVFDEDTNGSFTMAGVTQPLEITWFTADGTRVDGAQLDPCPEGTQDECPVYAPDGKYRIALEQPGGSPSVGQPTACG